MHQSALTGSAREMTFGQFLERVRYDGAYPSRESAEVVVRDVLAALGRMLTASERTELAACLPPAAADVLTRQEPGGARLNGREFVMDLAERTGAGPAVARWNTGSVLAAVAGLAGPDTLDRLLAGLPAGYALLFGRAELIRAA
ncbi:DUF2267 domain-containing protein [Streptomyces sp. NBC_01198]|uniref:DUF2267 domain-containing protein n=1 Tax=Streptomyces sp. NBC_01198 TaxID=2903769 RepID=UPI002E1331C8|nr:DUF2267 domain-containing protein [Streptomyces sp. NBC_01198]